MKKVYIAHPLRGDVQNNIKKVDTICRELVEKAEVIPFSPLHAFAFYDPNADQTQVLEYCFALLKACDELWVHGNWRLSEGCLLEISFATKHRIPIRFMEAGACVGTMIDLTA